MSISQAAWRKKLQPGSFRGVPFFVKAAQTQVGRRVEIHEYPQRDKAFPEDLGLKADAFTIEALVIGPDYFSPRDALIEALKKRGSGELVHPYYGRRTVTLVSPARISETPQEGGLARFTLDFVEAGENEQPSSREDTQSAVESAADDANAAIADDFAEQYSLDGTPDFVGASALNTAKNMMSSLETARRSLVPDLSMLSAYMASANGVVGNLTKLIRAPAAFAQSILGMVGALKALALSPLYALNSYRGLFSYGGTLPGVPKTTASRVVQSNNQAAMASLTRRAALVEAARVASRLVSAGLAATSSASRAKKSTTISAASSSGSSGSSTSSTAASSSLSAVAMTYDQAVALRDELAALLDDEAAGIVPASTGNGTASTTEQAVSETVYQALTALRVALVRDLTARSVDAAHVSSTTLSSTMPALVAAYKIYGDATRADEIVSRNSAIVRHPGFVPGGTALEIIAD